MSKPEKEIVTEPKNLVVTLSYDHELHDPSAAGDMDGCWRIWCFSNRFINHKSPDDPDLQLNRDGSSDNPELQKKLEEGLAFNLGYFEHGNCLWFLKGQAPPGANCPWDGTPFAGIAIWEEDEDNMGAKTYEDREKDCRSFLESYTCWCNGDGYGYAIVEVEDCPECKHEHEKRDISSCWGYFGNNLEYMFQEIRSYTQGHKVVRIEGDAKDLANYCKVQDEEPVPA